MYQNLVPVAEMGNSTNPVVAAAAAAAVAAAVSSSNASAITVPVVSQATVSLLIIVFIHPKMKMREGMSELSKVQASKTL